MWGQGEDGYRARHRPVRSFPSPVGISLPEGYVVHGCLQKPVKEEESSGETQAWGEMLEAVLPRLRKEDYLSEFEMAESDWDILEAHVTI